MRKIDVKGTIVSNDDAWIYELFEIEHTSPKKIDEAISEINGENIVVEINSGGGSVFAGSEIYTKIKKLNANVEIVGIAGSAASVIAMAGNKVSISPTAQIMIHNASTIQWGDRHSMEDASVFLESIDSSIANVYKMKTGLEISELADMMSKETWLNANAALEKGFADEIMFSVPDAVASVGVMLPENVINKVRNVMKKDKEPKSKADGLTVDLSLNEDFMDLIKGLQKDVENIKEEINNKTNEKPIVNDWLF